MPCPSRGQRPSTFIDILIKALQSPNKYIPKIAIEDVSASAVWTLEFNRHRRKMMITIVCQFVCLYVSFQHNGASSVHILEQLLALSQQKTYLQLICLQGVIDLIKRVSTTKVVVSDI